MNDDPLDTVVQLVTEDCYGLRKPWQFVCDQLKRAIRKRDVAFAELEQRVAKLEKPVPPPLGFQVGDVIRLRTENPNKEDLARYRIENFEPPRTHITRARVTWLSPHGEIPQTNACDLDMYEVAR